MGQLLLVPLRDPGKPDLEVLGKLRIGLGSSYGKEWL